jgi:hypothetical protein
MVEQTARSSIHAGGVETPPTLPELKTISTLQGQWNKILEMALAA